MDIDLRDVGSAAELGEVLSRLKLRSGRSLSQLSKATAANGTGGLSRSTLNGYFKGRHLPQHGVGAEFRRLLRELGVCEQAELDQWWATVERLRGASARTPSATNPYPGLRSFDAQDATRFFGRRALTEQLVARVTGDTAGRPVVVVGPSGAGKSSLLRAGLAPALSTAGWDPVVLTPAAGRRAMEAVGTDGPPRVLVVDQIEEIFASEVGHGDRESFVAAVCALARSVPTVLGLRADFYAHALRLPELASAVQHAQVVVPPLLEPELREAITEPARAEGFRVDEGLVELLLREVAPGHDTEQAAAHEQGALPLLSHALRATFDAVATGDNATLTVRAYQSTGGIRHAVAESAETVYRDLDPRGRQLLRQVFLRLVHVGDGTADTRRTVDRDELVGQREDAEVEELDDVLDVLLTRRLLTAEDAHVRISHEALITAWPRLRGWLDDNRAGRRLHHRLTNAAREWRDGGRGEDDLYQGKTLMLTLDWAAEYGHEHLNPLEREFLDASTRKRDLEQAATRTRARRRHQLLSLATVLVMVLAGTGLYAWQSKREADEEARVGLSRKIAAKATRLRDREPALAAQLAAVAYRSAPTMEARSALLDSATGPLPKRGHGNVGRAKFVAATGKLTAVVNSGPTITLTRPDGTEEIPLNGTATALTLSNDSRLAAVTDDGTVHLWNTGGASAPRKLATLAGPVGDVASVEFSPDGTLLAAGGDDGTVRLWRLPRWPGEPAPGSTLLESEDAVTSVAFGPDGRTLVAGGRNSTVYRFDLSNPAGPRQLPSLSGPTGQVFSVAVSPRGDTIAAGTAKDRAVYLWTVSDPLHPEQPRKLTGPASWVTSVDFSPDGRRLAAASSDSNLWQWDLDTTRPLDQLPHPGVVTSAEYVDDGAVLTLAEDGIVRRWPAIQPAVDGFDDTIYSTAFFPDGRVLAVGPGDGNAVRLIDVSEPGNPKPVGVPLVPRVGELTGPIALSPNGTVLAAGTGDGRVFLWDTTDPERPRQLGHDELDTGDTVAALDIEGDTLAVGTQAGRVSLIDIGDPGNASVAATVGESPATLNDVRLSPDGTTLATGSDDGNAYLYDVTTTAHPRRLTTVDAGGATSVAFAPDGTTLAVGSSDDDRVSLWNLDRRAEPTPVAQPLDGPVGDPYQLAFRPDGDQLAVASVDGTVWTWDVADPEKPHHLATLSAPSDAATAVAYAPHGTHLAGGSRDGNVYLWPTDPETAVLDICARSGDTITEAEWRQFLPDKRYEPTCPTSDT